MASGRGKSKDAIVTDEQLAEVEYELARNRNIEKNEKRMALIREKHAALREVYEASQPAKQRKRKAPSSAPDNTAERRVLRSRGANGRDNANPTDQPSKEITTKLVDGKKGGRTITKKANIYARMNKPKIKIPFNEHGQPIGLDATEFANFIGTLVRKHIPPKTIDWRDVDEEKKLLVWDYLQAFYEVDSIALRYVINTSLRKWKEWKADLKKTKFDPELTDEELMHERDERISEADWKELLKYWRSPEFEARSCTAKENRAKSTVPHTAGSKSHARVTQEMADELGYAPRRDEVFIKTHTLKKGPNKGQHVPEAASVILLRAADDHPEWKEKSLKEGDLFARVVGLKEPRGRVRVLGLGPTPQDVGTPGTRGKVSTRVLVEMVARREAEHRMSTLEEQMQHMEQRMNKMQEMMSQGGHNLEAPSSQHGSNSRQNSRAEIEEEIDGEDGDEEDSEDGNVQRRKIVANPRNSSTQQDESLIGMNVLLYAWTGPETPVAKATVLSVDPDTIVGGEPLGPGTYEVIVNVAIKRDTILPYQCEDLLYISDAVTRSIAWPSSKIKPYKPAASTSSRR
ncbi:hypothetical protein ACQ4PT_066140 [Festuca glaucescens]